MNTGNGARPEPEPQTSPQPSEQLDDDETGNRAHNDRESSAVYRRIIRAAEELFKKSGFRGVTMEAVARDASVAKATLYGQFHNKDELFMAVCARMARRTGRAWTEELTAPHRSVDDRVRDAILAKQRLMLTLVRSSPHAEDLFTHKAQVAGDLFAASEAMMLETLEAALNDDVRLAPTARTLARALFHGSGGLAGQIGTLGELETELSAFVAMILVGARTLAPVRT